VRLAPIAAVRAALPRDIPVVGNGDVKTVEDYQRMKAETGCDAVMIGRGAMGNPWFFRTLAALERGLPAPPAPSLAERHAVWRRHADLVCQHSPEKMMGHELRKTLAWYSRGLYGGADLRQRTNGVKVSRALLDMGEEFFSRLIAAGAEPEQLTTEPADPVAKSVARKDRRSGGHAEAPERIAEPEVPERDHCAA
jgi:tRNA-dihydrouridine synthase